MKVGVLLPSREAVMAGHAEPDLLIEAAERAEHHGFDSVWVGDSLFHRPRFEPLTMLAAVAARTQRITLGTAILIAPMRHPVMLAHQAATLDRIAHGRLVLGLGSGWVSAEFDAVGVPFEQRLGRTADAIRVCRALWRGEDPSKVGTRYWDLPPITLNFEPFRPGGPPVWLGSAGPKGLALAGEASDGWMPTSPTPEAFAAGWDTVSGHAGERAGSISRAVYLTVNLGDDHLKAAAATADYAEHYYGVPFEVMRTFQAYYSGDADGCVAWLRAYGDAGAGHLIIRFATLNPVPQLEEFAASVLPHLR